MTREEAIEIIQDMMNVVQTVGSAYVYKHNGGYERLRGILDILRSTPQPGNPLTLDQLREMDGQPVWIVEYPDWGHWELSEDANDYIVDRNLNFYGMKHDDPDGRYGLHKLGWLAYSYPPAHIDRSKWKPCEHCKSAEYPPQKFGAHQFPVVGNEIYFYDTEYGWEGEEIKHCPWCGRPLTEEAWAELERRLRG